MATTDEETRRAIAKEVKALGDILDTYEQQLAKVDAKVRTLEHALSESVKLQAHYAKLLNMHDGGQRMIFPTAEAWLKRLASI